MDRADNVISFDRLDRVRALKAEQARLARRLAELESQIVQRLGDVERRFGAVQERVDG
jgi:hypothetical protein